MTCALQCNYNLYADRNHTGSVLLTGCHTLTVSLLKVNSTHATVLAVHGKYGRLAVQREGSWLVVFESLFVERFRLVLTRTR